MNRLQATRHECLLQLYGSQEIPISASHVCKVAEREGFDFSEQEIRDALFFLRGQGFCQMIVDSITGEPRHRITSAGMLTWERRLSRQRQA